MGRLLVGATTGGEARVIPQSGEWFKFVVGTSLMAVAGSLAFFVVLQIVKVQWVAKLVRWSRRWTLAVGASGLLFLVVMYSHFTRAQWMQAFGIVVVWFLVDATVTKVVSSLATAPRRNEV